MENKRNFKDKEEYGYINIPQCCNIYEIKTLTARYDANNDNTKVLYGMWCFNLEDREYYDNILDALKNYISKEYHCKNNGQPLKYWITVTNQNQILDIHVISGNVTTPTRYNAFSTIEDAEVFLQKIKLFLNRSGINLGNWK